MHVEISHNFIKLLICYIITSLDDFSTCESALRYKIKRNFQQEWNERLGKSGGKNICEHKNCEHTLFRRFSLNF